MVKDSYITFMDKFCNLGLIIINFRLDDSVDIESRISKVSKAMGCLSNKAW